MLRLVKVGEQRISYDPDKLKKKKQSMFTFFYKNYSTTFDYFFFAVFRKKK